MQLLFRANYFPTLISSVRIAWAATLDGL